MAQLAERLLVIFPHPDDEAFGVSGTIALHTSQGKPVTYVCLTLGEMGRNMGSPFFANRETLPAIRRKELDEACRAIGIRDLRLFGYRDKTLEFEDEDELIRRISTVIQEVQPSLIITFYPGYSVHPDHEACGEAVIRAVQQLPETKRPTLHCVAFSKNCVEELGEPDVINDVSSVLEQKIAAIQAHRSQTQAMKLDEKVAEGDQQTIQWLTNERFWTYKWPDNVS